MIRRSQRAESGRSSNTPQRPLRVGLNLLFLGERAGGAGRYARELPGALLAADSGTEVHVFVSSDAPADLRRESWASAVRWCVAPTPGGSAPARLTAEYCLLPALAAMRHLDVLHSPANTGPTILAQAASVVSILDLIWLHRPFEWEASERVHRTMRRRVERAARDAQMVFAISQAAADDLIANLGVPRERIEVTPLGVRPPDGTRAPAAHLRAKLSLGDARIVLCVAQKRPYKNLHRLIEALPRVDEDVVLVLPGAPTAYERELRARAQALNVTDRIRFPDWLSEAELGGLYALSDAFVLPSLIEGFGLPVLEAMAHGVPVACSNVSALPEVAGDAALMFDPESSEQLASAIQKLLDDPTLAARLVARGRERVLAHTWRRTGEASLAGYRRAITARG